MTPITNPAIREAAAAMQAALKTGSEKEINQAFELFNESVVEAVKEEARDADIICKAAAVADYRPKHVADEKIKKADGTLFMDLEKKQE